MKRYWFAAIVAAVLVAGLGAPAQAADGWKTELTPYLWFVGVDGDVEVDGQEVEFDRDWSDIHENVEFMGGALLSLQSGQIVGFFQGDYLSFSRDDFDNPTVEATIKEVNTDWSFVTAAIGYQFPTFRGSHIDVMVGGRIAFVDVEVDPFVGPDLEADSETLADGVLVLRPSFRLTPKFRFNPTFSVGAGDSDIVYELQPQVQYNFTENLGVRFGYRMIHYEVETDRNRDLEVEFSGLLVGLSFLF